MRIVVIGPTYPYKGGISHYTDALVHSLEDRGHAVSLISFRRQYPGWLYPGKTDRDPSLRMPSLGASFLLDPICPTSWRNTAAQITAVQPEAVVMQWWTTYWAPAFTALGYMLRQSQNHLLYLVHNVIPHEPRLGDTQLTRLALHWGQAFITWNALERQKLLPHIPRVPVELCPMPVCRLPTDSQLLPEQARAYLGLPAKRPVILFFGFIRPYKGLRYLLDAVARMRDSGMLVHLVIAGECWENKAIYLNAIQKLHLGSQVRIDDHYIPNEDVGAYFAAANVCVAPYIQETQSAVATMALRFGTPLVVSKPIAFGLPADRRDIRVVPHADPAALAEAISALCQFRGSVPAGYQERNDGWDRLVRLVEYLAVNDHGYANRFSLSARASGTG